MLSLPHVHRPTDTGTRSFPQLSNPGPDGQLDDLTDGQLLQGHRPLDQPGAMGDRPKPWEVNFSSARWILRSRQVRILRARTTELPFPSAGQRINHLAHTVTELRRMLAPDTHHQRVVESDDEGGIEADASD